MSTIETNFNGFKSMASEFLKALPTLDIDGIRGGTDCFNLAYLGLQTANQFEEHQSLVLVEFVNKEATKREFELSISAPEGEDK